MALTATSMLSSARQRLNRDPIERGLFEARNDATVFFNGENETWSFGTCVVTVSIDPDTGPVGGSAQYQVSRPTSPGVSGLTWTAGRGSGALAHTSSGVGGGGGGRGEEQHRFLRFALVGGVNGGQPSVAAQRPVGRHLAQRRESQGDGGPVVHLHRGPNHELQPLAGFAGPRRVFLRQRAELDTAGLREAEPGGRRLPVPDRSGELRPLALDRAIGLLQRHGFDAHGEPPRRRDPERGQDAEGAEGGGGRADRDVTAAVREGREGVAARAGEEQQRQSQASSDSGNRRLRIRSNRTRMPPSSERVSKAVSAPSATSVRAQWTAQSHGIRVESKLIVSAIFFLRTDTLDWLGLQRHERRAVEAGLARRAGPGETEPRRSRRAIGPNPEGKR